MILLVKGALTLDLSWVGVRVPRPNKRTVEKAWNQD